MLDFQHAYRSGLAITTARDYENVTVWARSIDPPCKAVSSLIALAIADPGDPQRATPATLNIWLCKSADGPLCRLVCRARSSYSSAMILSSSADHCGPLQR